MTLAGQKLGHYHLVHLIGQGGMGEVYLAEDMRISRQVAIKVIHNYPDSQALQEAKREIRAIAQFNHPYILSLYDFGEQPVNDRSVIYMIMPYCPDGSLKDWLVKHDRTQLTIKDVGQIIAQAASALQHAHDHDIIHQDVKPANFLVRANANHPTYPDLLLVDFGIAKFVSANSTTSHGGSIRGTISYMAPEQWLGKVEAASDQYALAVMTYQLLTGQLPFQGPLEQVMYQHMNDKPKPLSQINAGLLPVIDDVILHALAKEANKRFPTVKTFAEALEQACQSSQAVTNIASSLIAIPPTIVDTILALPFQASITLSSQKSGADPLENQEQRCYDESSSANIENIPITDLSLWSISPVDVAVTSNRDCPITFSDPVDPATLHVHSATPDSAHPQLPILSRLFHTLHHKLGDSQRANHPRPSTDHPAQMEQSKTWKAFMTNSVHTAATSSSTVATSHPWGTPIAIYKGHSDWVRSVAWSPDGDYLATAGNDKAVQIWDPSKGRWDSISHSHAAAVHAVSWAPKGAYLVTASADNTVVLWVVSFGQKVFTCQKVFTYCGHSSEVYAAAWSPDALRLVSAGADKIARLWDTVTCKDLVLYKDHEDWIRAVAWSPDGNRVATASNDRTVHIWDAATGCRHLIYKRHTDWVRSVSWSPDGKRVATASNDQTVHIWDATTGRQQFAYQDHTARWPAYGVLSVSWSPNGKYVAFAGEDQTAQICKVPDASFQKSGAHPLEESGQKCHDESSSANLPQDIEKIPSCHNLQSIVYISSVASWG